MIGRILGEALAGAGLSDHQQTMVGAGQFVRDASRTSLNEAIMRNLDVEDPQVRAFLENALPDEQGILRSIFTNIAGAGFGQAFSFVMSAENIAGGHRNAIMQADANGVPGFTHTEIDIGGISYEVWVDASPEAIGDQIDVYTSPATALNDNHAEQLEAHVSALEAEAIGEVHDHLAAGNSPQSYIDSIENLMERIIETVIQRQAEQHSSLGADAENNNTIAPTEPPPPGASGPTGFA